ncbi:MAG: hypothetical protein HGA38_01780 [Candidatus Moranbacteria bacterium]|nr:hypothetical protein [Candidatus Moranbacteria bacterium]
MMVSGSIATASAKIFKLPIEQRPQCSIVGDKAYITYVSGAPHLRVVLYEGDARVTQEGLKTVISPASSEVTLQFINDAGEFAYVKDGPRYNWSKGINSEPTSSFGGTAEGGACLTIDMSVR